MRLDRAFYQQPTLRLARSLLGKRLVHHSPMGLMSGWIVEVEAYLWRRDPACHAAQGINNKNRSMFGSPGTLYVYCIHASWCMNVVSEIEGRGAAVLIRAIQPFDGVERMRQLRHAVRPRDLTNGPGKLCQALGIDRSHDGIDLVRDPQLWIEHLPGLPRFRVLRSPRIGIREGTDLLYRFFVDGHDCVSGPRHHHRAPRTAWMDATAPLLDPDRNVAS